MTRIEDDEVTVALPKCSSGKRCYADKKAAQTMANLRRRHGAPELRPYRHELCGCWHLTKEPLRFGGGGSDDGR